MQYKVIFRCHPCFQSDGPIYDWMKVKFDGDEIPCRLASVVILNNDITNLDRYRLVVQRATTRTKIQSVLLTEWFWSPMYYVISTKDIIAPCFVISIKDDNSKIQETLAIEEWYKAF